MQGDNHVEKSEFPKNGENRKSLGIFFTNQSRPPYPFFFSPDSLLLPTSILFSLSVSQDIFSIKNLKYRSQGLFKLSAFSINLLIYFSNQLIEKKKLFQCTSFSKVNIVLFSFFIHSISSTVFIFSQSIVCANQAEHSFQPSLVLKLHPAFTVIVASLDLYFFPP